MADVFISYSRKDIEFAQRLNHELECKGRAWALGELTGYSFHSRMAGEVYAGIQPTDTFLFLIDSDSAILEICTLETEHAI